MEKKREICENGGHHVQSDPSRGNNRQQKYKNDDILYPGGDHL